MHKGGEERKKQILDAAIKVFSHKGFFEATTDDIIKKAKIGKGTIYRYFKNKEDLYLNIVYRGFDELEKSIIKKTNNIDSPLERIEVAVKTHLLFFEENPSFMDMVIYQPIGFRLKVREYYFKQFSRNVERGRDIFAEGIKKGIFREDVDSGDCLWVLFSMVNGLVFNWCAGGKKYSLLEKADTILKIIFLGIVK